MCGPKGTSAHHQLLHQVLLLLLVLHLAYLSLVHLARPQPRCCLAIQGWVVRGRQLLQQQVDSWALQQQAVAASAALAA